MAVGGSIGGIPAISAVCVIFVGILGAVFGHTLLNAMHIRTKAARGLAMGLPRTPSVRRAAPSWIIRKVHLVRWRWCYAG
ncbi:membrane protein LrgB-like family [Escherichia coli]|nr:membrane protein LrgB-like family [Escherichia coli]